MRRRGAHEHGTHLRPVAQIAAHFLIVVQVLSDGHVRESTPVSGTAPCGLETDAAAFEFVVASVCKVIAVVVLCRKRNNIGTVGNPDPQRWRRCVEILNRSYHPRNGRNCCYSGIHGFHSRALAFCSVKILLIDARSSKLNQKHDSRTRLAKLIILNFPTLRRPVFPVICAVTIGA